jgi:hypothetical protein
MNALNLSLRFLLELWSWIVPGIWVFRQFEGLVAWILALAASLALMAIWGTFAVLEDPSRSGKAAVPVNGKIRLLIELCEFGLGAWAGFALYGPSLGFSVIGLIVLHHLLYFPRMQWIWKQKSRNP